MVSFQATQLAGDLKQRPIKCMEKKVNEWEVDSSGWERMVQGCSACCRKATAVGRKAKGMPPPLPGLLETNPSEVVPLLPPECGPFASAQGATWCFSPGPKRLICGETFWANTVPIR